MTAKELQAALRIPAHAQSVSQLVIHYESEWYYQERKWDALDKVLGHTFSAPMLNWIAEKERVKKLAWWGEVAAKGIFPKSGRVCHLHPIRLLTQLNMMPRANDLVVETGQVTFDAEGNDDPASFYFSRRLHWPGGASGVTLGRGYDMRHRTSASVYADLIVAGVEPVAAKRFSTGAGLYGQVARDFVSTNRDAFGAISREAQRVLFEAVVYPGYLSAAMERYSNAVGAGEASWDSLDSRIQDIAVDLTYQQGRIWDRQIPYISENNSEKLAAYIRETPELTQYEAGRGRAKYLTGRKAK
ncbi:hypothetical protein [Pseudomonas sp. DY-1]|uniref:hypothetical protein n=1 Tax=Pseudomonas sp. DY-1 TaxID=1755504 RepID=UPI0013C3F12E|nr:hypothetical protein [Pseudomonas sp. DY-1]